jgi:excisionase family DNA binding protein
MTKRKEEEAAVTLTVRETATHLRIGLSAAYAAVKTGEIPSIKIGKRILVPVAALERILNGNNAKAA